VFRPIRLLAKEKPKSQETSKPFGWDPVIWGKSFIRRFKKSLSLLGLEYLNLLYFHPFLLFWWNWISRTLWLPPWGVQFLWERDPIGVVQNAWHDALAPQHRRAPSCKAERNWMISTHKNKTEFRNTSELIIEMSELFFYTLGKSSKDTECSFPFLASKLFPV